MACIVGRSTIFRAGLKMYLSTRLVSENKHVENSFILLSKLHRSTRDVIIIDTEVHNDLREMITTHINNTAAGRRRCPSRNDIISSPLR